MIRRGGGKRQLRLGVGIDAHPHQQCTDRVQPGVQRQRRAGSLCTHLGRENRQRIERRTRRCCRVIAAQPALAVGLYLQSDHLGLRVHQKMRSVVGFLIGQARFALEHQRLLGAVPFSADKQIGESRVRLVGLRA